MNNYTEYLRIKSKEYGVKFDNTSLNKNFIFYYENQQRIELSFKTKEGKEYEIKRGKIGITTGWKPCFLLMLTTRSRGSSYTIGLKDTVIKIIK